MTLLSGCLGPVAGLYPPDSQHASKPVWVINHGWHTGIAIRRIDAPAEFWSDNDDLVRSTYVEFGWGDADYYRAQQPTSMLALKAALGFGASVLHVVGFDRPPDEFFSGADIVRLEFSRRGFDSLLEFIHETYARDDTRRAISLEPKGDDTSVFYLARGRYYVFNTCNNWTARAI